MKVLKQRETLTENMAFMGIVSAILIILNALISVGDMFFPIIGLILSLVLPILVVLVEVSCKDRYYPIFFSVTILLSMITCLWNIQATFYYLIPSLISGYIFGLFIKKRFQLVYGIFIASVIQAGLIYGFSRLVLVLFEVNSIETFLKILSLNDSVAAHIIVPSAIFVLGLIEISFVTLVISFEIKRFNLCFNDNVENELYINIVLMVISALIVGLYFLNLTSAYIALMSLIFFTVFLFANGIKNKEFLKIGIFGFEVIVGVLIFVLCNRYLTQNGGFLLIGIGPLLISLTNLIFNLLKKRPRST